MTALKTPGNPGNARYAQFKSTRPQAGIYPLTLYYESACPLCYAEMSNLMLRNQGGQLRFADVSAPGFADVPEGATMQDLLALIHARTADGRLIKGVEVFELAYRAVGLDWISAALRLPVLRPLADWGYPVLARNRHRIPRRLVGLLFEGSVRRAAERAASARCDAGTCSR